MKKLISTIFAVSLLFLLNSYAQKKDNVSTKKELTIEEVAASRNLYPKSLSQIQWRKGSEAITYVKKNVLFQENLKDTTKKQVFSLDELNAALKQNEIEPIQYFPQMSWNENNTLNFSISNGFYSYELITKKLTKLADRIENAENYTASEAKTFAYTMSNNLYISDKDKKIIAVTSDENKEIVNGQTVSRNEFGIDGGIFWSPSGKYLAYYIKDESQVGDYPLLDIDSKENDVEKIKYPMAGSTSEFVQLGVFNTETRKVSMMKTHETDRDRDQYLTCISWSQDEKSVYIAVLNREQDHLSLRQYDVETGQMNKEILQESNEKYVEPENPLIFFKTNQSQFLWFSKRDGFNHLYLYNTKGELIKQITSGKFDVLSFVGFDKKEENIFIMANAESPIEKHLYKVNIASGKMKKLTETNGYHSVIYNDEKSYFLDIYSSTTIPRKIDIINTDGKLIRNVLTSENPLKDYNLPNPEIFTISSSDETTDLYCRLIKPVNFDPVSKYPLIVYVYGGPHNQLITNSWLGGARMWDYFMAQKGYVVLSVDNRGSANRGFEFESAIHRNLGTLESEDQIKAIKYLSEQGYINMNKIGVHGWSYGGFMTITLMEKYPDIYKVGVAGGPVCDWNYYEVMYGERYMDTPTENPDGYNACSPVNRVKELRGKLLIIHGLKDDVVVLKHSLSFIQNCISKNIPVDYFIYPEAAHGVSASENLHLMKKITQYFDDYLK